MDTKTEENLINNLARLKIWQKDVFLFCKEAIKILPAEPIDSMIDKEYEISLPTGYKKKIKLFDNEGRLIYHDLQFYKKEFFKNQGKKEFKEQSEHAQVFVLDEGKDSRREIRAIYLTWQQTVEMTAYQRALDTFEQDSFDIKTRQISIRSGNGVGKLERLDTPILCKIKNRNIWKTHGDLEIGDIVHSPSGLTKIKNIYPQGKMQIYRVTFDDNSFLDVGGEHLWNVKGRQERRNNLGWATLSTEEIINRGVKRKNGNKYLNRQFEIPKMEIQGFKQNINAYVIGAWYGDGSCGSGGYTDKSHSIVNYLKEKKQWEITTQNKDKNAHHIKGLLQVLRKEQCSLEKEFLPKDFLSWDIESRKELLRGLCDTDGTIGKDNGNIEFGTIRKKLADDVVLLIRSLGGKARINTKEKPKYKYKGKTKIGQRYYRVSFQTPFNPFKVDISNRNRWKLPQERYLTRWIDKIETVGNHKAQCIEVDNKEGLYISGRNLVVTHNTSFASIVSIHFLLTCFSSQIGATANTEDQLRDIFLKEFYRWKKRLPTEIGDLIVEQDKRILIDKDWFLRARVAGMNNPEALSGLHAPYILLFIDEASGVADIVFDNMKGATSGANWIVIMTSNPTRTEGYFYESQKKNQAWTKLHFNSEDSPIVQDAFFEKLLKENPTLGKKSDNYIIYAKGDFIGIGEMDDKGWTPLFANVNIHFEGAGNQIIRNGIVGVDPAGQGKDKSEIMVRDAIYLKNVLTEATSTPLDLARKVETVVEAYNCSYNDVGVDGFGEGSKTIANIRVKVGQAVTSIIGDLPTEDNKHRFTSFKAEMAWRFREWLLAGGIIVTNNRTGWLHQLEKIKFKRNRQGKIELMGKVEFKKLYGFSPDKFDGAIYTFFKTEATTTPEPTKIEKENREWAEFQEKANSVIEEEDLSSM